MAQVPVLFVQDGESVPYTPISAVTAGDVVVINGKVYIARVDIAAGALGNLWPLSETDVYAFPKDSGTCNAKDDLYWHATGNPVGGTAGSGAVNTTSGGGTYVGKAQAAALTGDTTVNVEVFASTTVILDVFDRYNFTVNEAEPLEKEVAIDPEMLGKVFENLIEENRRKGLGSFYTPREIVHYMCQESLINWLDTAINKDKELAPRKEIETFIYLGEQISHYEAVETRYVIKMPKSIEQHARLIDEKLAAITVCDPAVGSGAFPVGMMTEIVRARSALTPYFNDVHERSPYHFKRHAIQNSLYGVDIDAGAVDIAKLRLWLSLVVDEEDVKQIKPLPNLDYKIVAGNSLIGVEKSLFNVEFFNRLEALKPLYFDESDKPTKAKYGREIDQLIHRLTNGKESFDFEIYFSEVFHQNGGEI